MTAGTVELDVDIFEGRFTVLFNQGEGVFGEQRTYRVGLGSLASPWAGDIDGDRDLDLVVASGSRDELLVFFNLGGRRFSEADSYKVGSTPSSVRGADLDGDGNMDHGYTTAGFMVDAGGGIDYEDRILYSYEFVDDNDDLDRYPDWRRSPNKEPDRAVFPGWDENNDFISDFNQNDNPTRPNFLPDYEEPFLRYNVDRPDYLFGINLNNNGWIDRFENDDEPDYPYRKDHRGYNFHTGVDVVPGVRMTIGQLRERLLFQDRHNLVTYGLFALDRDYGSSGRLRIFESLKKVKDNIPGRLVSMGPTDRFTRIPPARRRPTVVPEHLGQHDIPWV